MLRTPVLFSEALLALDVYVCLERPSGALPPECRGGRIQQGGAECIDYKTSMIKEEDPLRGLLFY